MDLKELSKYTSCDVADALIKLGIKTGYLSGLKLFSSQKENLDENKEFTKIIGFAFPVQMVIESEVKIKPSVGPTTHWIDQASKGDIVYIQQPTNVDNAVFGGLMGARAKFLDVAGVIVNGNIRDVKELKAMGINVFAKGQSVYGAKGFTRPSTINEPIRFTAPISSIYTFIKPRDIIIADTEGVVTFSPEYYDKVVEECQKNTFQDDNCMEKIKEGMSISEAFEKFRA